MITFRGNEEEKRVAELARLLGLARSEVLRRAVNHYCELYQSDFKAYDWLVERLEALPGSGRSDVATTDRRGFSVYRPAHVGRLANPIPLA